MLNKNHVLLTVRIFDEEKNSLMVMNSQVFIKKTIMRNKAVYPNNQLNQTKQSVLCCNNAIYNDLNLKLLFFLINQSLKSIIKNESKFLLLVINHNKNKMSKPFILFTNFTPIPFLGHLLRKY